MGRTKKLEGWARETWPECRVDGCATSARYSKIGLCGRHYQRLRTHGDVETNLTHRGQPALQRFLNLAVLSEGCWPWAGNRNRKGYGMFHGTKAMSAHKWAYTYWVGPVPEGLQLDHLCRNRGCVNPAHLEPVTNRENQLRSPISLINKTHCIRGHGFTPENTYVYRGTRSCKKCHRMHCERYVAKQRRAKASAQ